MNLLTAAFEYSAATTSSGQAAPNAGAFIPVAVSVLALALAVYIAVAFTRRQRNASERGISLAQDPQLRLEPYREMSITAPGRRRVGGATHLVLENRGQSEAFNVQAQILQWDSQRRRKMSFPSIKKGGRGSLGVLENKVRYVEVEAQWETVDGKTVKRRLKWPRG